MLVLPQEWLRMFWIFSSGVGVNLHNPPANGKQGPIPEEIYQTPLTNKKQRNLEYIKFTPQTLLSQLKLALPQGIHFLRYKIIGKPKNLRRTVPCIGLEPTMHVL